ncbi:MAG TPA: 16S rRNA (cytosine(1402)-N(4))-methyltransferase RsmH [Candidatus Saccharimonadia bacterium]|nr:16S rRNA (cytosine(1402)-N(4))-methyltransferase RsmH [Candidatus Saccharimonadia bacterium]
MPNSVGKHLPVMLEEAIDGLKVEEGKWYVDATFGRGGHTREILNRGGNVIAFDHDEEAIMNATQFFAKEIAQHRLELVHENFAKLKDQAAVTTKNISGILFDFGVSSPQLDDSSRGFSFQQDAPLDMRMDNRLGVRAADLVNALGKKELFYLLTTYAQETRAHVIVDAILRARSKKPIETTTELAEIIENAIGRRTQTHLHPATKTFLALRMVVNDELGSIESALPTAFDTLSQLGRLVTISFNESEDRIVKHAMVDWEAKGKGKQLTKKPLQPTEKEVAMNARSRSAKLRIFEKETEREE